MSKHITSRRDRQSVKYKKVHAKLRSERDLLDLNGTIEPLDKRERKKQRSRDFMAGRD